MIAITRRRVLVASIILPAVQAAPAFAVEALPDARFVGFAQAVNDFDLGSGQIALSLQGPSFDAAFASAHLAVQTDCEAPHGAYSQNGKSGPLRRFAQVALPKAKERLDLARLLAGGR